MEKRRETVEEFLARGGKIEVLPPKSAIGHNRTFSARKIRSANTASAAKGRARNVESKATRGLK